MKTDQSCSVALYRERNHATLTSKNATADAAITQPETLKSLAIGILRRNLCNPLSNSTATEELPFSLNYATQSHEGATQKITPDLSKYGLTMDEVVQATGEDFVEIKDNLEALKAVARMIRDNRLREAGKIPPGYTVRAHCYHCGDIWLPPGLASTKPILGCPWCHVPKNKFTFSSVNAGK